MKLSLRGEYALRALLVLGLKFDQPVTRIQTISDHQNIPKRFLEQILNDLKSAGLVVSKRGVAGGYRLARPPREISLASVIRHIEGALARCAEDVVFRWIADPRHSRHAGTAHGKQEFLARLLALDDDFEYRHFVPVEIVDGRVRVETGNTARESN